MQTSKIVATKNLVGLYTIRIISYCAVHSKYLLWRLVQQLYQGDCILWELNTIQIWYWKGQKNFQLMSDHSTSEHLYFVREVRQYFCCSVKILLRPNLTIEVEPTLLTKYYQPSPELSPLHAHPPKKYVQQGRTINRKLFIFPPTCDAIFSTSLPMVNTNLGMATLPRLSKPKYKPC